MNQKRAERILMRIKEKLKIVSIISTNQQEGLNDEALLEEIRRDFGDELITF